MNRNSMTDELQRKLDNLPDAPGVYLWKDQQGKVIYVGQAVTIPQRITFSANTSPTSTPSWWTARHSLSSSKTI